MLDRVEDFRISVLTFRHVKERFLGSIFGLSNPAVPGDDETFSIQMDDDNHILLMHICSVQYPYT